MIIQSGANEHGDGAARGSKQGRPARCALVKAIRSGRRDTLGASPKPQAEPPAPPLLSWISTGIRWQGLAEREGFEPSVAL